MLGVITTLMFAALVLAGCGSSASGPQGLYESKCGSCHPLSTVENAKHTKEEWKATVDRMKAMGGSISDSDAEQITTYIQDNIAK